MKKLVYVTGAGRGIGQAIAVRLSQDGYEVAGCSRTKAQLEETAKLSDGKIKIAQVDVTDFSATVHWMDKLEKETGATPWGLVTAAGVYGPIGTFLENDWKEWVQGIEINLFGTALSVKAFAQKLISKNLPGRIVLLSGGGATKPLPHFSNYCASKAAVVRFGETVAHELAPHHITVNSIAPGAVNTRLIEDLLKAGPTKAGKSMYEKALQQKESGGTSPTKAAELTSYLLGEHGGEITSKLLAAVWDPWPTLHHDTKKLRSEIYTLRRVVPQEEAIGDQKK